MGVSLIFENFLLDYGFGIQFCFSNLKHNYIARNTGNEINWFLVESESISWNVGIEIRNLSEGEIDMDLEQAVIDFDCEEFFWLS